MIVHLGGNNALQGFIWLPVGIVNVIMIKCLQENAYNYIGEPKSLQNMHQCVPSVSDASLHQIHHMPYTSSLVHNHYVHISMGRGGGMGSGRVTPGVPGGG